jgi:hypothetical protein
MQENKYVTEFMNVLFDFSNFGGNPDWVFGAEFLPNGKANIHCSTPKKIC